MTPDKTPSDALAPCPFCGAGEMQIHVNKGTWRGHGYGEPVSVEVRHWCADVPGQPSRMISRAGRDEASAIAAWNTRAKWGSPVVAGKPVAWQYRVAREGLWFDCGEDRAKQRAVHPDKWEVRPLFSTPQPTQAQAGAVALTDNELVRLSRVGAIQTDDSGKVMLWPASYKTQMEDRFKSGWREAEKHHGITKEGGQP